MMTRTISVIAGTSVTLATGGVCPNMLCLEGYCNGVANTQYFLQLHKIAPANLVSGATVPLRSFQVLGANGFTFDKEQTGLQLANLVNPASQSATGYYMVLSSTDAVYTTPGITCDINVEIEEFELELTDTSTNTGNSAAGIYAVFADPNVSKRLVKLTVLDTSGVASFVQVFAKSPVASQVPIQQWPLAANATLVLNFGSVGESGFDSQDTDGTNHSGCYIGLSQTTGSFDAAGAGTVTAIYK